MPYIIENYTAGTNLTVESPIPSIIPDGETLTSTPTTRPITPRLRPVSPLPPQSPQSPRDDGQNVGHKRKK